MAERWGIDLGGSKIEGVVLGEGAVDPSGCVVRLRLASEAHQGYDHLLKRIETLISQMEEACGPRPSVIGFGTPGSMDPRTGRMRNCNSIVLNGRSLQADLQDRLGVRVEIENDANCFALAEARWGAVRDAKVVFGVILGTGVGGGIVIDGKVLRGRHGIAGEWGHNPMPGAGWGASCYCGRSGCIETVLSGPALERFYADQSGITLDLATIADRDAKGIDLVATRTIDRLCEGFGLAIATVVNLLDPDAIVIGGGVGNIERLYRDAPALAAPHVFHERFSTPILCPVLGDSAGVFGAALLIGDEP